MMSKTRLARNKKGIELSINFIVMLVLAIAVFAGGLVFASKFFSKAGDIQGALSSQTQTQIEALLDDGSPTVLPIHTKSIPRNTYDTFGLGIMNIKDGPEENFTYSISFTKFVSKTDTSVICNNPNSCLTARIPDADYPQNWITPNTALAPVEITLKRNEKKSVMILVQVPQGMPSGSYLYKIEVKDSANNLYDAPLQMIVKLP